MARQRRIELGEARTLRCDHGPVSFGLVLSGALVSWSAPGARDLLIGRCWEGIYHYPSRELGDAELAAPPARVFGPELGDVYALPADWNRDGREELLATNREGFVFLLERSADGTQPAFSLAGVLRGSPEGLPFNVAHTNADHPALDSLGGYIDLLFYNYISPAVYPLEGRPGLHLVIGDWGGNLWWLPDGSGGEGMPRYEGEPYEKRDNGQPLPGGRAEQRAKRFERYGTRFLMPRHRLADTAGRPFVLGTGVDTGVEYRGGNTRPVVWRNPRTGGADLLVLAGMTRNELRHLERCDTGAAGMPVFRDTGVVPLETGGDDELAIFGMHSKVVAVPSPGGDGLLVSAGSRLARFRFAGWDGERPRFRFGGFVSGDRVPAIAYNFTELIAERATGRRFVLDCPNRFVLREVTVRDGEPLLSDCLHLLRDQGGVFSVEGETDPQGGKDWGFHRACRWDFDGSGRQHLVVGTDRGLLYLLVEREPLSESGGFAMSSAGPLRDSSGAIVKIHNRVAAAGFDVDGDGRQDLVVGGGTYQLGIRTDPRPGGGIYWMRNRGLDAAGLPVVDPPRPLEAPGLLAPIRVQDHVQIQVADLDGDGEAELVIAVQAERFAAHVYRRAAGGGLEPAGIELGTLSIDERLLDIDGDGRLELVFAGGESGVGSYRRITLQ